MLSSLEALDEPLEPTSTVPKVGAFQPKAKPRAKKSNASSNAAGKSKTNFVDKKIPKPTKVTEIKPIVKENPLSPSAQTIVGSQVIHRGPLADNSIDIKPDGGPSAISIVTDPIEEKPVLDAVEKQAIFSSVSAFPEISQLSEDSQLISSSNPIKDTHVSVLPVHEPVLEEIIGNSASLQTIEDVLVPVPWVQETVSTEVIPPLRIVLEEATLSIPSVNNAADGILPPSPVVEVATALIDSEPKPVPSQTILSLRPDIQSSAEGVNILDYSSNTQAISPSPFCNGNPQSKESPSVLPQTTARIATHDNDEPESTYDFIDASFPSPESNCVGEHTVAANGHEKLQAVPRNSKRKLEAMPHCFIADVGESAENACKSGFQNLEDLENGTDYIMNLDDRSNNQSKCKREKIPVRKPSNGHITVQHDFLDNGENCFVSNTNISSEGSVPINSSYEKKIDQQRGWRKKLKVQNASDSSTKVQNEVLEDRENPSFQKLNSFPDTEVVLENSSEGRIINHSKHSGLKMKARKVANGSARMQQEVRVENSQNEFATGNDTDSQFKNKLQQKRQKTKGKKATNESMEAENCSDLNSEAPMKARKAEVGSAKVQCEEQDKDCIHEFDIENNLDDQQKHKSKQKRAKTKGQMASEKPAKRIQETPSAAHVSSNVETGENRFDINVDTVLEAHVPSDDPPDKNNIQTRLRKRKPTPLSKDVDNDLNIHSEDQESEENARVKQRQNKRKASADGKSLELSKKKFSHSTVRHRRRVEKHLLEMPEADLDPKKLKIKDLIRLAEAKEKIRNKEEAAKRLQSPEAASNSNAIGPSKEPDEDERASLAPQFKIVDGEIVLDEESLVVTHRELNTDDLRTYRRVEESTSKLNYHTYMNRTPVERWSKSETELFYKAMQQFGTDFAMIQHLFPGRTRRQVKSKFKMEERKNPLQLAIVLTNRPQDNSQYEKLIEKLKISPVAAENSNEKKSTSICLEDTTFEKWSGAHEEAETINQINSTFEIPETQESEKTQGRENDSMLPEDISEIDKSNATSATLEDLNKHKEDSPSPENVSNEPIAKPKSLFSYQVGTSKPKSLFGYQL